MNVLFCFRVDNCQKCYASSVKINTFVANGVYVVNVLVCHNQKMPRDCYLSMLDVQMGNAKNKRCIVKRNKEELRKGKQQDLIGKKP